MEVQEEIMEVQGEFVKTPISGTREPT